MADKKLLILDIEENHRFWGKVATNPHLSAQLLGWPQSPRDFVPEYFCRRAKEDFERANQRPDMVIFNLELFAGDPESFAKIEELEMYYQQNGWSSKLGFAVWDPSLLAASEDARMAARISNLKDIIIADTGAESVELAAKRIKDILDGNDQNPAFRSGPPPGQGPDGMKTGVPKDPYPPVQTGAEKQGIPVIK